MSDASKSYAPTVPSRVDPLAEAYRWLKYHGGLKATVTEVQHHLPRYRFVLRTDVFEYYVHIDHEILIDALASPIKDQFLMNLVVQYLKHTVDHGCNYHEDRLGISRGCPLSPLIGAFYLQILDEALGNSGLYYVRYMDDVLILAPTRWRLRKAIRVLQGIFTRLKLRTRTDKTSIGRIEKGFDFLGYHLTRGTLTLAHQSIQHFTARLHRFYEQQKRAPEGALIVGKYVAHWLQWTRAGLAGVDFRLSVGAGDGLVGPLAQIAARDR